MNGCDDLPALEWRFAEVERAPGGAAAPLPCMDGDGRAETLRERAIRCLRAEPLDLEAGRVLDRIGRARDAELLVPLVVSGALDAHLRAPALADAARLAACRAGSPAALDALAHLGAADLPIWVDLPPSALGHPEAIALARVEAEHPFRVASAAAEAVHPARDLLRSLADPDPWTRRAAAAELARARDPELRERWRRLIVEGDDALAAAAIGATQRVEDADRPVLERLAAEVEGARGEAARALLARHPGGGIAPANLFAPEPRRTPPADAALLRREALAGLASGDEEARIAAALLLQHVGLPEDVARLAPWVPGDSRFAREAGLAVARIGGPEAWAALLDGQPTDRELTGAVEEVLRASRHPEALRYAEALAALGAPGVAGERITRVERDAMAALHAPTREAIDRVFAKAKADPEVARQVIPVWVRAPAMLGDVLALADAHGLEALVLATDWAGGRSPAAVVALAERLAAEPGPLRQVAVRHLLGLDPPRTGPWVALAGSDDPRAACDAIGALRKAPPPALEDLALRAVRAARDCAPPGWLEDATAGD